MFGNCFTVCTLQRYKETYIKQLEKMSRMSRVGHYDDIIFDCILYYFQAVVGAMTVHKEKS